MKATLAGVSKGGAAAEAGSATAAAESKSIKDLRIIPPKGF
ncbi:MAG: hypothetical protein ACJ8EB_07945 [Allosphingosinicella sp.]